MKPLLLRNPSSPNLFLRHQKGEGSSDDLIVHGATVILPSDGRGQVKSLIIENAFWRILPTVCLRRKWVEKISICKKLSRWVGEVGVEKLLGDHISIKLSVCFSCASRRSVGRLQSKNTLQFLVAHALKSQGCGLRLFSEFICRKLDLRFACLQAGACTLSGLHFRNPTSRSAECLTKLSNDLICP